MKTSSFYLLLSLVIGASVLVTGCSSAKKEADQASAPAAEHNQTPGVASPVDLGASSSGRSL